MSSSPFPALPPRTATVKDLCVSIRNVQDDNVSLFSGGTHYPSMSVFHDPFHRAFTFGNSDNNCALFGYEHLPPRYHVDLPISGPHLASFSGMEGDLVMGGYPRSFLFLVPRPGRQLSFQEAFSPSEESHLVVLPHRSGGTYRITPGTIVVCLADKAVCRAMASARNALKESKGCYELETPENIFVCFNVFLQVDTRSPVHQKLLRDCLGVLSSVALRAHRKLLPQLLHDLSMACIQSKEYRHWYTRLSKTDPKKAVYDDLVFDDLCLETLMIGIRFVDGTPMPEIMPGTVALPVPYLGWPTVNRCHLRVQKPTTVCDNKRPADDDATKDVEKKPKTP
jgi:hypothetical protein